MDVMLSDEVGCLPEQLFLEVVKCLELGAGFPYSSSCQEQAFSEAELPAYPVSRKLKGQKERAGVLIGAPAFCV